MEFNSDEYKRLSEGKIDGFSKNDVWNYVKELNNANVPADIELMFFRCEIGIDDDKSYLSSIPYYTEISSIYAKYWLRGGTLYQYGKIIFNDKKEVCDIDSLIFRVSTERYPVFQNFYGNCFDLPPICSHCDAHLLLSIIALFDSNISIKYGIAPYMLNTEFNICNDEYTSCKHIKETSVIKNHNDDTIISITFNGKLYPNNIGNNYFYDTGSIHYLKRYIQSMVQLFHSNGEYKDKIDLLLNKYTHPNSGVNLPKISIITGKKINIHSYYGLYDIKVLYGDYKADRLLSSISYKFYKDYRKFIPVMPLLDNEFGVSKDIQLFMNKFDQLSIKSKFLGNELFVYTGTHSCDDNTTEVQFCASIQENAGSIEADNLISTTNVLMRLLLTLSDASTIIDKDSLISINIS